MAVSLPFLPIPTMPKYRSSKWQSSLFPGHLANCPQGVWFLPGALLNPEIKICLSKDKYPQDRVLQRQLRWNGAGTGLLTLTNYSFLRGTHLGCVSTELLTRSFWRVPGSWKKGIG